MESDEVNALASRLTAGWTEYLTRLGMVSRPRELDAADRIAFDLLIALYLTTISEASPKIGSSKTSQEQGQPPPSHELTGVIHRQLEGMHLYEDTTLHDLSLECIPLPTLYDGASVIQASPKPLPCWEDALAEALVKWFKQEFFKWVDPIPCPDCGGKTEYKRMGNPTEEEKGGGGGRVELHECNEATECRGLFRFARYNDPKILMKTRIGRCGEWANLFCLFIRAVGLRARYVWNAEDHVWNEYYSPAQKRWIHMDSCEGIRDEPLLYDRGWGKKMTYVFAFSIEGVQDVTPGYVQDWEETLKSRRKGSEEELARVIKGATLRQRFGFSEGDLKRLEEEDAAEARWLNDVQGHSKEPHPSIDGEGRQTGPLDWKIERGEAGVSKKG